MPALVLVAAVSFNAALAIVNAHVGHLSPGIVIAVEATIVVIAHGVALSRYSDEMDAWYVLLALMVITFLIRSAATGTVDPKLCRDVILIPTFIVLGLSSPRRTIDRTVLVLLALVTAVALLEALLPGVYTWLFDVPGYYINTRGNTVDEFDNTDSDLFISAVRPGERMFAFIDMPRLSSIFLEPVSLGNFCSIITAFVCARYSALTIPQRVASIAAIIFLLIGCDGRLATATIAAIAAMSLIAPWLPLAAPAAYLPIILAAATAFVSVSGITGVNDDIGGRVARTVELLQRFDLAAWLGAANEHLVPAMDSGIAYLIATQSIIATMVFWVFIACASRQETIEQKRYLNAAMLYLSLTMLVSYSMLTIKTAAILWFVHGSLQQPQTKSA